jgi:hypothetical protein
MKILIGKLEGKRQLGRSSRLRKVIWKLIFKNILVVCGLYSSCWRKGQWETATDTIMKIQFPRMRAISLLAEELSASWS